MMVDPNFFVALPIILLAGVASGLTGFGFALVGVPPLLLIFDPPTVVIVTVVLALVSNVVVVAESWRDAHLRTVAALVPWACVGLFVGAKLLQLLDPDSIRLGAGIVVVGFALLLFRGASLPAAGSTWAPIGTGALSGVLATSTGLSGPPIVLLFAARGLPKHAFRSSNAAYFLVIGAVALTILTAQGTVTPSRLLLAATLAPAALGGKVVGTAIARRISGEHFRQVTLALLLLAGAMGVATAAVGLLT